MKKIIQTKKSKMKEIIKKRERKQYRQLRDHDFEVEQFLKSITNKIDHQTKQNEKRSKQKKNKK